MSKNNYPRVLTQEECTKLFAEYQAFNYISDEAAMRFFRARSSLKKYLDNNEITFDYFHAANEDELNLQAQWKIASCYYAAFNGEISMADALGLVSDIEWFAYEFINEEHEVNEAKWPFILKLLYSN